MNIQGLNKAEVLAALYNGSKVQGLGFLQSVPGQMSTEQAESLLKQSSYFDYVHGKVMKIDLSGDEVMTHLYNRDNGEGRAEEIIEALRSRATVEP